MVDLLLVTPQSRKRVYQNLSNDFAAIEPPVWSGLIAQYISNFGYDVAILDSEADLLDYETTVKSIIDINPKLVCFSIYGQQPSASTQCMPGAIETCRILDEQSDKKYPTIAIGTHPSALPKKTLEDGPFKFVGKGECIDTIRLLIEYIKGSCDIKDVPGLYYYEDKKIISNKTSSLIKDLDSKLPRQKLELLDMKKYKAHNWHTFHDLNTRNSYASLQTSLGCPFKCTFCCINAPFESNQIRFWSPDNVISQIDELVNKYNVKNIKIPDEMFVLNTKQVMGICDKIIERNYDLNFWAYARIDTLQNIKMLEKMKKAGIHWLGIGIESASEYVRDGVIKGRFKFEDIIKTIERVRQFDFNIGANYIFGLPDDDYKSMRNTIDFAKEINSEWANFYSAMAYPGSALYGIAKNKKMKLPEDEDGPGWIGYSQHAFETMPLSTDHVSYQEVLDFRDNAFNEYFTNQSYLNLIDRKFGSNVVKHIKLMTKTKLKRAHHIA